MICSFAINFYAIDRIVNSEPNYYSVHRADPGYLFSVFYEISGDTGFIAEPSKFNFGFTMIVGLIFGVLLSIKVVDYLSP